MKKPKHKGKGKGPRGRNKDQQQQRGKKVSILTADPKLLVDYKDANLLRRFMSPDGKILPRRITKCTAKQQRQVTQAIKRARHLGLISYTEGEA
jgi:small subunit ribosomal protein S18